MDVANAEKPLPTCHSLRSALLKSVHDVTVAALRKPSRFCFQQTGLNVSHLRPDSSFTFSTVVLFRQYLQQDVFYFVLSHVYVLTTTTRPVFDFKPSQNKNISCMVFYDTRPKQSPRELCAVLKFTITKLNGTAGVTACKLGH